MRQIAEHGPEFPQAALCEEQLKDGKSVFSRQRRTRTGTTRTSCVRIPSLWSILPDPRSPYAPLHTFAFPTLKQQVRQIAEHGAEFPQAALWEEQLKEGKSVFSRQRAEYLAKVNAPHH